MAAADKRIVTLAKRAKASSMNMPPKAARVASLPNPMNAANATNRAAVTQTSIGAVLSLPV